MGCEDLIHNNELNLFVISFYLKDSKLSKIFIHFSLQFLSHRPLIPNEAIIRMRGNVTKYSGISTLMFVVSVS